MDTMALIVKRLAAPKNFRVVTTYECGKIRTHDTETRKQAENHAKLYVPNIGRDLIDRETGATVRVVSVDISEII